MNELGMKKLPKGAILLRPAQDGDSPANDISLSYINRQFHPVTIYQECNPLLYTIHELEEIVSNAEERATLAFNESRKRGERIYELEADIAGLKCDLHIVRFAFDKVHSDAERLRKAIEEARKVLEPYTCKGDDGCGAPECDADRILKVALSPSPAAAGSADYDRGVECDHE